MMRFCSQSRCATRLRHTRMRGFWAFSSGLSTPERQIMLRDFAEFIGNSRHVTGASPVEVPQTVPCPFRHPSPYANVNLNTGTANDGR